ncbi:MAG: peptidoglycan DD-metalloendopeptidase family protein [Burkholderiaceae bacterium]|nr:peptidoglycan DD-metalloendopeptidase family protein [Burkholderiaceae bacterium]
MTGSGIRSGLVAVAAALLLVLGACSSGKTTKAPVEDRGASSARPAASAASSTTPDPKTLPGAENAGKPGYYTVKRGDTLMRIAMDAGQAWRDVARWNNLDNVNLIEVGQVLRIAPPVAAAPAAVAAAPGAVVAKPIASSSVTAVAVAPGQTASAPVAAPAPAAAAASANPAAGGEDELVFIWPANGTLIAGFDEAKNKGLDIGGNAGDPVYAAADGRVVYAGAGLRGYGNLLIIKHNNTYLTAYAHNQSLLVKEDEAVRKGQKIAVMGNSDADRVKLHFEVRRQGKPVDPAKYLPAR